MYLGSQQELSWGGTSSSHHRVSAESQLPVPVCRASVSSSLLGGFQGVPVLVAQMVSVVYPA